MQLEAMVHSKNKKVTIGQTFVMMLCLELELNIFQRFV